LLAGDVSDGSIFVIPGPRAAWTPESILILTLHRRSNTGFGFRRNGSSFYPGLSLLISFVPQGTHLPNRPVLRLRAPLFVRLRGHREMQFPAGHDFVVADPHALQLDEEEPRFIAVNAEPRRQQPRAR